MKGPALPLEMPRIRHKPEAPGVFAAVQKLRALGYRVLRAGRDHHTVNGKRMATAKLLALADMADEIKRKKMQEAWANNG